MSYINHNMKISTSSKDNPLRSTDNLNNNDENISTVPIKSNAAKFTFYILHFQYEFSNYQEFDALPFYNVYHNHLKYVKTHWNKKIELMQLYMQVNKYPCIHF